MPTKTPRLKKHRADISLSHRLHALLHTVRTIAHYEDELCTLLHAAEDVELPSPALRKELDSLLTRIPAHAYVQDLDAVRAALDIPTPSRKRSAEPVSSKSRKPVRAKGAPGTSKAAPKTPATRRRRPS